MIELISLSFGNLRSFVDDQNIVFKDRDKLVQIDGFNENTGGSSGAGKTSILMALDYLLGIGDIPTTVLQSRLTKDSLWVSGEFVMDGIPVSITRSKKNGLTIVLPDETITGNVKIAEERLSSLIGLPGKILKKMIHKKQKEGGFFLNMTPKETYEFLILVLGLEKHLNTIDKIHDNTVSYQTDINNLQSSIKANESSLSDLKSMLSDKKKPESSVTEEEIEKLNKDIVATRESIDLYKQSIRDKISAIPAPNLEEVDNSNINAKIEALSPIKADLKNKLDKIDKTKMELESELSRIPLLTQNAVRIGSDISKLKEEKTHIEKSQCPTCMQKWIGDSAKDKITQINGLIDSSIGKALVLKESIDKKPHLQDNLEKLLKIREDINTNLSSLQDQRSSLDAQKYQLMESTNKKNQEIKALYDRELAKIEEESRALIDDKNKSLKQAEVSLSSKESERRFFLTSSAQYEKEMSSIKDLIEKKMGEIDKANKTLQDIKHSITVADESKRLIKTYVLQTFQETLDAIGEVATNILSSIPNMSTSTIYFEGCKETKSGTIKDEVVAILNLDGSNGIPIKSLSGGERTSIDLAIDLAVIDVIETKASKGANFLFMDEPFDGLDAVCKENCLEILKQLDTNKKIIMVDHSSELKEMVSDIILVRKHGEYSSIVV